MENSSIFVQIASYRDSQLIPTLLDLIKNSKHPQQLRVVVCWQHSPDELLGEFWKNGFSKWTFGQVKGWTVHFMNYNGAQVELIDVPHMKSQGACWARNLIQQHYNGERYTLQLDSHHRFVKEWDELVVGMLESLRDESPKPVLTTYLPPFQPGDDTFVPSSVPTIMTFDRFIPEGSVFFRSASVPDWEARKRPVPGRFYSAHFAFADGHFAREVQHDPEYFFHGEEISIAVRAFTHGYDLYHPHRAVAWHEYTRSHRPKMWDDHTGQAKEEGNISQAWWERNEHCHRRNRALFAMDDQTPSSENFGKYGFGSERTLVQYEYYAGLIFSHRAVHQATLDNSLPVLNSPVPDSLEAWESSLFRSNDVRVCLHHTEFDKNAATPGAINLLAMEPAASIAVYDDCDAVLHSKTFNAAELKDYIKYDWLDMPIIFLTNFEKRPNSYSVKLLDATGKLLSKVKKHIDR